MLYDPARHEALRGIPWDEDLVCKTIEHIVADAEEHFTPIRYWQAHPLDVGRDEGLNGNVSQLLESSRGLK